VSAGLAAAGVADPGLAPEVEPERVDLLVFEVGPLRYATDAARVLRIAALEEGAVRLDALGALKRAARALVVEVDGAERQVAVDGVLGIKPVAIERLRRFPQMARAGAEALGVWLDGDAPVVLIDLEKAVRPFV
jgi:hypothetical protein